MVLHRWPDCIPDNGNSSKGSTTAVSIHCRCKNTFICDSKFLHSRKQHSFLPPRTQSGCGKLRHCTTWRWARQPLHTFPRFLNLGWHLASGIWHLAPGICCLHHRYLSTQQGVKENAGNVLSTRELTFAEGLWEPGPYESNLGSLLRSSPGLSRWGMFEDCLVIEKSKNTRGQSHYSSINRYRSCHPIEESLRSSSRSKEVFLITLPDFPTPYGLGN